MGKIKSIASWVVSIAVGSTDANWMKGSRVQTKHGPGTVIGGSISVRLDRPIPGQHENDRSWTFNLDKTYERK